MLASSCQNIWLLYLLTVLYLMVVRGGVHGAPAGVVRLGGAAGAVVFGSGNDTALTRSGPGELTVTGSVIVGGIDVGAAISAVPALQSEVASLKRRVEELEAPAFTLQFGKNYFAAPGRVAFVPPDKIMVTDGRWSIGGTVVAAVERVRVFNVDGTFLGYIGTGAGTADNQFASPQGIAYVGGEYFVADNNNLKVFSGYSSTGDTFLRKYDGIGVGSIVEYGGNLWMAHHHLDKISCLTATAVSCNGQLTVPNAQGIYGLAVFDSEIYVTGWGSHTIEVLDMSGQSLRTFGSEGTGDGQFRRPVGIQVYNTSSGARVFVLDQENNRIQVLSANPLAHLYTFGSRGAGEWNLARPIGMALANDTLCVGDFENRRVIEFNVPQILARIPV